jgi:hypothetical protein
MLESLLEWLVKNRQDAGLVGYLFVTLIFGGMALHKEWLVLGKMHKQAMSQCKEKDEGFDEVSERLTDQRILNERATVTIEALREKVRELELALARSEGEHTEWQRKPERRQRP